ncbi:glycine-rich RNA-binding protein RZ1A-like [Phragmites australis]|uniref:glycine-rich RNA-binding protein RZ1A-like n=1 Tax=Phragmites australis TaxID=29695 RepID=UPI002D7705A8|nr:glycine-rich RNA-binding protein RZ1A-like [Phragmites australis]
MAVDEVTSVYVGGLPYEANEDMLRDAFEYYGTIVAVKVINDHKVKGKCYGFVTFTHPKAAEHAIAGMDGKKIGSRVVRVNEVRTRGPRDFGRDDFRRDPRRYGRDPYWDRRDRERSYDRDRDPYHDRDSDRSREHDRDRDYEHGGFNRENDYPMDRDQDHEVDERRPRDLDHAVEMHNMDSDNDRDKEHGSRKKFSRPKGRDSRDLSSSSDDLQIDGKNQLEKAIQMRQDLENEVNQVKDKVAAKEQHITDLQKKAQKLEDELAAARKVSSERQLVVTDLYKHFLQLQDYNDRVKTAEQKLQSLVDSAMDELDMAEDATTKDGSMYENGVV